MCPLSDLVRIGTRYGGSTIPSALLHANSITLLAGAGEDISFDVGIVQHYGCKAHILDPTPRARCHFDELTRHVLRGQPMPINHSKRVFYSLDRIRLPNLHFHSAGLAAHNGVRRFYAPLNQNHVSHTPMRARTTQRYFDARTERLKSFMDRHGIPKLDLLKLDIAGAEYEVLPTVVEDNLDISALCVEFVEYNTPASKGARDRIEQAANQLIAHGYVAVNADANCNVTFLREDVYRRLAGSGKIPRMNAPTGRPSPNVFPGLYAGNPQPSTCPTPSP